MAHKNTKYAIYVLAGIIVLSLVIYPNSSTTGNPIYEENSHQSCSDYFYPGDCEAAGCTWTESGCIDGSSGGFLFPGGEPDPCDSLGFWNCITTEGCTWDFLNGNCYSGRIVACGILDYQECIDDPDCHWQKKADGSCECAAGGSDILPRQCENCIFEPQLGEVDVDCRGNCPPCRVGQNCNDHDDCQSEFCDFIPYLKNLGQPTFKCKACDQSTADDNIQNCGETGIDCGGGFASYPCHCFNGIGEINLGENGGIDCSVVVPAHPNHTCPLCINNKAPHCFDDILNKGEECADCGGSCNHIKVCDLRYKKVTLKDVSSASTATVVVDVDGATEVVTTTAENVNGVSIKAVEAFYEENKADRAATIVIGSLGEFYLKVGEFKHIQVNCQDLIICNLIGYWWCDDKQICMKQKNLECYISKATCENAGGWWCPDKLVCNEEKNVGWCFNSSKSCEAAGYNWCPTSYWKCWDEPLLSYCYTTKTECENEGFWWCVDRNKCLNEDGPYCYTSKTTCESAGYDWCDREDSDDDECLDLTKDRC